MLYSVIYASIAGLLTVVMIYMLFVIDRMKNAKNDGKWGKRTMPEFLARCNPLLEERIAFGKEHRIDGTRGTDSADGKGDKAAGADGKGDKAAGADGKGDKAAGADGKGDKAAGTDASSLFLGGLL
jgi:hypothetical protein